MLNAALSEIGFAFDQLGADGVVMVTNYGGNYLGQRQVRTSIRRTRQTVGDGFPPSTIPAGYDCVACGRPGPVIEFTFDTCRTVADMLYAGVLNRHKNISLF